MSSPSERKIHLEGVRQNNLKNITVDFPFRKLSVVTGLSGSGKSSLAFDTLYAEGQRRYIESLSTYTRQFLEKMPKPEVDHIDNIPPAVALEQRNTVVNSRSTVGTQTEIVDYLRILFAKIGTTYCLDCESKVRNIDPETITTKALSWLPGRKGAILAPLLINGPTGTESAPKKSSRKKTTKKKKAQAAAPTIDGRTLLLLLREQGFRRILWKKRKNQDPETLDLETMADADFPTLAPEEFEQGRIFVVVDRLRVSEIDDETRARVRDSVDQAVQIGKGRAALYDLESGEQLDYHCRFACENCGREHRLPEPNLFSFNSPLGACPRCSGFGYNLELDESLVVPDPSKTLKNGAVDPLSKPAAEDSQKKFFRFLERHGVSIGKRYSELTASQKKLIWEGDPHDSTFPGVIAFFKDLERYRYKLHVRVFIRRYQSQMLCPVCQGARLNSEALAVRIGDRNISQALELAIIDAKAWFDGLKLSSSEETIAREALLQVQRRLQFLESVGVGYLTLNRLAKTLSGGEFQRINLATQLGSGLCGTLYVLDEPSIGLHAADTEKLIDVLKDLRDQGNTVVVVEHDLDVMRAADWLVELGPGSGYRGGEVIAQGDAHTLARVAGSLTGKYLSGAFRLEPSRPVRGPARHFIKIVGCRENNLKNLTVEFPLERFVIVTGVSGSGKSTLIHKTLHNALARLFHPLTASNAAELAAGRFERLYGADKIRDIVLLDQKPIGRSSRSNPATYLKAWDEIRRILANQVLSLRRGYTAQHFSFNVDGGRCPVCKGEGEITIDMHFMAEVKLPCEECDGKRFKKNVLEVTYKNKNVFQILETTIDEAYEMFRENPVLRRKLGILRDVGLGYLHVGQSATTLSGGESQRLKIAASLDLREKNQTLYVFDEPTTGLHQEDIRKLMEVIQDLVDARNSVIMIEHHLDVIAQADWVIDLGPTGGDEGGHLMAEGPPHVILRNEKSVTGRMLRRHGYEAALRGDPRQDPQQLTLNATNAASASASSSGAAASEEPPKR